MILDGKLIQPGTFSKHLVARAHKKQHAKRALLAGLMLTSMVDMFSLLVIFLLQVFSATPELLITRGVELPVAMTGKEVDDAPVLALTHTEVFLDQKRVGDLAAILKNPDALMNQLADLRERWQRVHINEKFRGQINLQADRTVPSTVVSQIMAMLPSESYGSIQLAVVSGGGL